MVDKLSKSKQHLDFDVIADIYLFREKSLKLFFSKNNPAFVNEFAGLSQDEIRQEYLFQISEANKDACLTILAAIEAVFRLDYTIRCEKKYKDEISRNFRSLFAEYQYKLPLEDGIFDEWKKIPGIKKSFISDLKGAFKYRHWLAHGRYWTLKAGKPQYDFYELYILASKVSQLPLKRA